MTRITIALLMLVLSSCGKDPITPPATNSNTTTTNLPAVAVGGPDRMITLPDTSDVILDGTRSYDPDGIKLTLSWTQISGPPVLMFYDNFTRPGTAFAGFGTQGTYQFQLVAKDDKFTAYDTVEIVVRWAPHCNPNREMVSVEEASVSLSPTKISYAPSIVYSNGQLVFAGGPLIEPFWPDDPPPTYSSLIHLYDVRANSWTEREMTQERGYMGAAIAGNKLFLGGGIIRDGSVTDDVEIHDLSTKKIEKAKLSLPRIFMSVVAAGNKVVFAGGLHQNSGVDAVDIYDLSTGAWSTAKLSRPRMKMTTLVSDNKIYFMGGNDPSGTGWTNVVDIFDVISGTWSVRSLNFDGFGFQAGLLGNKMVLAGGVSSVSTSNPSSRVELVNLSDWTSSVDCSQFSSYSADYGPQYDNMSMAILGDKVYLGGNDYISEFNTSSKQWKYARVQTYNGLLFGYQNQLYTLRYAFGQDGNGQYSVIRVRF